MGKIRSLIGLSIIYLFFYCHFLRSCIYSWGFLGFVFLSRPGILMDVVPCCTLTKACYLKGKGVWGGGISTSRVSLLTFLSVISVYIFNFLLSAFLLICLSITISIFNSIDC